MTIACMSWNCIVLTCFWFICISPPSWKIWDKDQHVSRITTWISDTTSSLYHSVFLAIFLFNEYTRVQNYRHYGHDWRSLNNSCCHCPIKTMLHRKQKLRTSYPVFLIKKHLWTASDVTEVWSKRKKSECVIFCMPLFPLFAKTATSTSKDSFHYFKHPHWRNVIWSNDSSC